MVETLEADALELYRKPVPETLTGDDELVIVIHKVDGSSDVFIEIIEPEDVKDIDERSLGLAQQSEAVAEPADSTTDEDVSGTVDHTAPSEDLPLDDPVKIYLDKIGKFPLLNHQEVVDLAKKIEAGSQEAKRRLTESNLRLVVSVAKRYQHQGLELLDLIQEGNVGLIRGVEKFDWRRGIAFSTYATWWIRQAVSGAVADKGRASRIPRHLIPIINGSKDFQSQIEAETRKTAKVSQIAEAMGVSEEELNLLLLRNRQPVSLDTPISDDDDSPVLLDSVSDTADTFKQAIVALSREDIKQALDVLPERLRKTLEMRYGLDERAELTHTDTGVALGGISRERIRQIEAEALEYMEVIMQTPAAIRPTEQDVHDLRLDLQQRMQEVTDKKIYNFQLSARELEVLNLLHLESKTIADRLGMANQKGVIGYLTKLHKRTQLTTGELVIVALSDDALIMEDEELAEMKNREIEDLNEYQKYALIGEILGIRREDTAALMCVPPSFIGHHLADAYRKLGCKDFRESIVVARLQGQI